MKIDGSMISAYAAGKQRAAGNGSLHTGADTAFSSRNIPTVSAAGTIPSGLANTLWLTNAKLEKAKDESDGLIADFMELSKMTAAERLRKDILDRMGLDEASLAALPDEQREAIEEDIRRAIKEQLGIEETRHAGATDGQSAAGTEEAEA